MTKYTIRFTTGTYTEREGDVILIAGGKVWLFDEDEKCTWANDLDTIQSMTSQS